MTPFSIAQLWCNFLGNFPFKIGLFWHSQKMERMGVGGGPSAKQRHGDCGVAPGKTAGMGFPALPGACFMQIPASESGCGVAPSKTAGMGSPAPPGACFMQIPASESQLFLFSLTEGANSGQIRRSGQPRVLVTEWACPCHFSSLWWGNPVA